MAGSLLDQGRGIMNVLGGMIIFAGVSAVSLGIMTGLGAIWITKFGGLFERNGKKQKPVPAEPKTPQIGNNEENNKEQENPQQ